MGEVAVGHRDPLDPGVRQPFHPGADGAVEALAGLPHDGCAERGGPLSHLGVVAHHCHREGRAGRDHILCHRPDQLDPHGIGHGAAEPPLGLAEPLDGDEHDLGTEGAAGRRRDVGGGRDAGGHPGQCTGRAARRRGRRRLREMDDRVAVVGAGSWGTAVAALVSTSRPASLWVRSPDLAASMAQERENRTYLPGVALPDALAITASLEEAVSGVGIVFMAVPSHGFRSVLEQLAPFASGIDAIVSLSKGIEAGTNLRMSEVVGQVLPGIPAGVLTGPNLAREVAEGQPAASVVALPDEALACRVQDLVHTRTFRVYMGTDVVGCEIAGATKNVMAIAAGICDGLGFGENTRAVLITRGLAELGRLGIALGGKVLTFGGLAGVGDLVATCASPQSRNRTVGFELGRGRTLDDVVNGMQMVAEGVKSAGPLVSLARAHGVEMPIAEQVEAIVDGRSSPRQALLSLMDRPSRPEWDETLLRGIQG